MTQQDSSANCDGQHKHHGVQPLVRGRPCDSSVDKSLVVGSWTSSAELSAMFVGQLGVPLFERDPVVLWLLCVFMATDANEFENQKGHFFLLSFSLNNTTKLCHVET